MPTGSGPDAARGGAVVAAAPAKINVGLRIVGKRPDGYHDLETLFVAVDLEDRLYAGARPDGEIRLTVEGAPDIPAGEENLVMRAARLLAARVGGGHGADLRLVKRIPAGAGLGGGSSDAAAALLALDALWGAGLDEADFHALALALGSDVPFFLRGGTALGRGRGEILTASPPFPPWPILLAVPSFGVATRDAYAALAARLTGVDGGLRMLQTAVAEGDMKALARHIENDLEAGVLRICPALGGLKRALEESGLDLVAMTGSGSAHFGIARDEERMRGVLRAVSEATGGSLDELPPGGWSASREFLARWSRARDASAAGRGSGPMGESFGVAFHRCRAQDRGARILPSA